MLRSSIFIATAALALLMISAPAPATEEPDCSISPWTGLQFPNTVVGETSTLPLRIYNFGGGVIEGYMPSSLGDFTIDNSGFYSIGARSSRVWYITFAPTVHGQHEEVVEVPQVCLDEMYVPLNLTGLALVDGPACMVTNPDLDVGAVPVGGSQIGVVKITNIGNAYLPLHIPETCGPFRIIDAPRFRSLQVGAQETIIVAFEPDTAGPQSCVLDLGEDVCETITLNGYAYAHTGGLDQVGVWFEKTGTVDRHGTTSPFEEVTAYLMILNPSTPYGALGWECCVEVVGDVVGMSWLTFGDALNVEAPPCFSVGMTTEPLPGLQAIVLAEVTFLQPDQFTPTYFYVHPATLPSLPGVPVYADGVDAGHLIPLTPSSGSETLPVAVVNEAPTGVAEVPDRTALIQARPNPFNPSTELSFSLAKTGAARIDIHDMRGRRVRTLVDGVLPVGLHTRSWNGVDDAGRTLESGVYFARLVAGDQRRMMKLMLLK